MNRISRRTAAEEAEALLEVGRTQPVLHYDVELGLMRHQQWMRSEAPLPEWAAASKSLLPVVVKTVVSALLLGVVAGGVWLGRSRPPQPSAAAVAAPPSAAAPARDRELAASDAFVAPQPLPVPEPAAPPARRGVRAERTPRPPRAHRELAAARSGPGLESLTATATARAESAAPAATSPDEAVSNEPATGQPVAVAPVVALQEPKNERAPRAQGPDDLVEMQQVATAEQLLARSAQRALALVREGDARFAHGYFQQERAYIAIMALIRLGRIEEARTRAASFARRFPALPYGARIRSALEAATP